MKRTSILLLLAGLALMAVPAAGQQLFDVEFGYRLTDVTGNEETYRSQINERSGFLVRSLSLTGGDKPLPGVFDSYRLDIGDLGNSPSGSVRFSAGHSDRYRLRVSWLRSEHFSALAGFANPVLAQGIVPGQHLANRTRNLFDAEVEVLPGGVVSPLVGYSRNRYHGPGQTTYTFGGDEFRLDRDLDSVEHEVRVGAGFQLGPVSGNVVQGWRKFEETETLELAPGAGAGNAPGNVLGQPVTLSTFTNRTTTDANTPFTNAVAVARLGSRVKLVGSYVRANAVSDAQESEALAGRLVSFALSRFFTGVNETISARARTLNWRALGRLEVQLFPNVDLSGSYTRRHREHEGTALLDTLFLGTTTFTGVDPREIRELLESNTAVERTESIYEVRATARQVGPFTLTAAWGQTDEDLTVSPDPSEIVVPGGQGGDFSRRIRHFDGRATFGLGAFTVGAEFRADDADRAVVRTDFEGRRQYKVRAGWKGVKWLTVAASARELSDDRTTAGFDARLSELAGELTLQPAQPLVLRLSALRYEATSSILIRIPQSFNTTPSNHRERGSGLEAGLTLVFDPIGVEGSYARYENTGTSPFVLERARVRFDLGLWKSVGLACEWAHDTYTERLLSLASYEANRYGLFLRYRP